MNVREMLTKWSINVEHDKLDKVEQQIESIKHRLDFLAGYEVAKGLFEMVEKFGKMAEQLHLASASAGLTVEEMQKLSFAAQQSGVSAESMQTAMFRLSRAIYQAKDGSEGAQKNFSKLGITTEQIKSFHNSKDALLAIAERMKTIKDPIERSALAMSLLGRGSRDMVGFLVQGKDAIEATGKQAEQLGIILSDRQVGALVSVNHAIEKLFALFKAIAGAIAASVAPVFELLIEDFIKFFQVNRALIEINVHNWLMKISYAMGFVWGLIEIGTDLVIKLAKAFGFEDNILSTIATIVSLIGGLWALKAVFAVLSPAISVISFLLNTLSGIMTFLNFLSVIFEAPVLAIVAAIALGVIVLHDLLALLFNGGDIKKTWIGQFVNYIGEIVEKLGVLKGIKSFFGFGGEEKTENGSPSIGQNLVEGIQGAPAAGKKFMDGLGGAGGLGGLVSSVAPNFSSPSSGDNNVEINAPVSISVPEGTPPALMQKMVQGGIKDHLDGLMRQTQQSLAPAVAH